jgi:cytidyltransferase-like protein
MKIGIFVGSFKPPHKGHFEMVKSAIKKDKLNKVVIIISKNPRYLKDIIQNPKNYNISDFENEFKRTFHTKGEAYDYIKSVKSKYPSINAETSKKIWTIYLDFLKENSKVPFDYVIKNGFLFSPIMNTNVFLKSELKKIESKKNKYILYKSSKNAENSRFDYLLEKYGIYKNLISKTILMKYNINARDFRSTIDSKKNITKFLPKLPIVSHKMIKKLLLNIVK